MINIVKNMSEKLWNTTFEYYKIYVDIIASTRLIIHYILVY